MIPATRWRRGSGLGLRSGLELEFCGEPDDSRGQSAEGCQVPRSDARVETNGGLGIQDVCHVNAQFHSRLSKRNTLAHSEVQQLRDRLRPVVATGNDLNRIGSLSQSADTIGSVERIPCPRPVVPGELDVPRSQVTSREIEHPWQVRQDRRVVTVDEIVRVVPVRATASPRRVVEETRVARESRATKQLPAIRQTLLNLKGHSVVVALQEVNIRDFA